MARTVKFDFDPFELAGVEPPRRARDRELALEEISEYIVESVRDRVARTQSPVSGYGTFPKLSDGYKKFKRAEGEPGIPNLTLEGDMMDALECVMRGQRLRLQISGEQGDKADGHNNHSGDSELPLRRFIPDEGETFKRDILTGVRNIARKWAESGD